jgi:hypothetical protein
MSTLAVALLLFVFAGPAQRIETESPDRGRVTRVETAMNHLTVIELAEPVTLAAAGSPLFKIERRDNKVFIQPLEDGASTNLFVWTGSGRWSYELVPAASPQTMHFAIDEKVAPSPQSQNTVAPNSVATHEAASASIGEEMLLYSKPIRNVGVKFGPTELGVFVTDVYRKDDQLFMRYVVDNRTERPYAIAVPEVFALESANSQTSLHALRYSQLGSDIGKKIRSRGQVRIDAVDCEMPSPTLSAGPMGSGILIFETPPSASEPAVFRLLFPQQGHEPISLTLVL